MSISFSGLGSGMDYSSWVTQLVAIREQTVVAPLETKKTKLETQNSSLSALKTSYSSLSNKVQTFLDSKFGTSMDLFSKNKVTLNNDKYFTVSASNSVPKIDFEIEVLNIANSTQVKGSLNIDSITQEINGGTKLAELSNFKNGSFEIELSDGTLHKINLTNSLTVDEFVEKINSIEGSPYNVTLDPSGYFKISSSNSNNPIKTIGGTSNLSDLLNLPSNSDDGIFASKNAVITTKASPFNVKLVENGVVEPGSFKINGEIFTIDEKTTMNTLINDINTRKNADVTAVYNSKTKSFSLTSKSTGDKTIEIEDISGNFVQTTGLGDPAKQVLGQNAVFKINGEELTSQSNTVTSDDTGIYGLTLNLKSKTVDEDGKSDPVTVKIQQDSESIINSVKELLEVYNDVVTKTTSLTSQGGNLAFESALTSSRNSLTALVSTVYSGESSVNTLSSIGITTGAVGTSVENQTSSLKIDEEKFLSVLESDPESVKKILTGFAKKIEDQNKKLLDSNEGFFKIKTDSITKQISSLSETITRKLASVDAYEKSLTLQFSNMDSTIAKLQQQYSGLLS